MLLFSSADFFQPKFFRNTVRVSNGLDSSSVGPDLGPIVCNCYQKATKVPASKERVKKNIDWGLDMRHTSDLLRC